MESRASGKAVGVKRCIRLNLKVKISQFFWSSAYVTLLSTTGSYGKYCIRRRFVWYLPGRTTKEQSYKFPVCANIGVLFSLHIL